MQRRDHKYQGIMESRILSLGNNCITLSLKLVKNSGKCYDKFQALRKSSMSCWQNSFLRQHVGYHPTTITFVWLKIFCFTLGWNQLCTWYESVLGALVIHIQKKTWSPDFDSFITEVPCNRTRVLFRVLCREMYSRGKNAY